MRRQDREITREEAIGILEKGEYGVLSMSTPANEGYGIPLNYILYNNELYFHCATAGLKVETLRNNNKASFCVVGKTKVLPDDFGTLYESVIVAGTTSEVEGSAKLEVLKQFMVKYYGECNREGMEYIDKLHEKVIVIKMVMESVTGKARRQ
ncbi:MAG: pyridoxamine 5'-phosphate oxidase family protein [Paludibacter sp.]|nr:pyridoxamine 5'-phosphate oxidase family protein [Paludibacter sp.]